MVALIVLNVMLWLIQAPAASQSSDCLHGSDETAGDRARRQQAIEVAHALNAAQAAAIRNSLTALYQRGSQLQLPEMPDNFSLMLYLNGRTGYTFSLKDFADPCNFAIFSDQDGLVYATQPEPEPRRP